MNPQTQPQPSRDPEPENERANLLRQENGGTTGGSAGGFNMNAGGIGSPTSTGTSGMRVGPAPEKNPYDDKGGSGPATKTDLDALENGGKADGSNQDHPHSRSNRGGSTGSADNFNFNPDGDTGSAGSPISTTSNAAGQASGFGGRAAATFAAGVKNTFLGTKKRRGITIGGGIVGSLVVGGGILTVFLMAGPAQIVQLSQVLQRSFSGQEQTTSIRLSNMIGSATDLNPKDIGETRLSAIGRKYMRPYLETMQARGIEFQTNEWGQLTGVTFDTEKMKNESPETAEEISKIPAEERGNWLAGRVDALNASNLEYQGNGKFRASVSSASDGAQLTQSINDSELNNSKGFSYSSLKDSINTSVANRFNRQYFDNPNLFHPFQYAKSKAIRAILNKGGKTSEDERAQIDADEKAETQPVETVADPNVSSLKDQWNSANSTVTKALTITGGACLMRNTAQDVVMINRYRIVLPAAITALHFIALGGQIQKGQDISAEQIGAAEKSLYNEQGQGIWQGQALQVLSGNKNPGNKDIPGQYQQAFDVNTTANTIETIANDALGGLVGAGFIASAACSNAGLELQKLVTLGQIFTLPIVEVFSDGAATPVEGASLGARLAAAGIDITTELVKFKAYGEIAGMADNFVVKSNTPGELADDAFSGPLGGNLFAYGAREAGNMASIASGGIALSGTDSNTYAAAQEQQDQQQFRSEGFFARTFDINDSRSLFGHMAQSISPTASQNAASMVGGFTNLGGGLLSNLSSVFFSHSQAATAYDWSFPQYGIPESTLKDEHLADPYKNADAVAQILDTYCSNGTSCSSGHDYIGQAKTCFGAQIGKDSDGLWNVTEVGNYQPGSDIDPNGNAYVSADCSNVNVLPDWNRVMLFIFDTRTAQSTACFDGDDQACSDLGYGQSGTATAPPAPTSTADSTIDMDHLYDSSVDVACADNTKDLGVQDGYYQGKKVPIRTCAISNMPSTSSEASNGLTVANSRVSGALYAMAAAAKQDGVNPVTSSGFRSMQLQQCLVAGGCGYAGGAVAPAGYSNHQMGLAIDVEDSAFHAWMVKNCGKFGYKWYNAVFGSGDPEHFSPTGN